MILPISKLKIREFTIINASLGFVPSEDEETVIDINNYMVDLDFTIRKRTERLFIVFVKASINNDKSNYVVGHRIFAEGVCIFEIDSDVDLDEKKMQEYTHISAIPIAFSQLRGYIQNFTAYSPVGEYLLPLFNLGELYKQKNEIIDANKSSTKSTHKKTSKKSPVKKSIKKSK